MKTRHQQEFVTFPIRFAFNTQQFEQGMRDLDLEPTDTDKIYKLADTGGFYRRTDASTLHEMFDRHASEMQAAVDGDQTGDGFIFQMFDYELANHEYGYTGSIESTLDALDLAVEDVNKSPQLLHGLQKAMKHQRGE
ncbi:MAG: hypothetical protein PHS57_06285 [Alphaproteobacteria bacterium]|nr:hypothetical protein [Alphaproteobacteria bacterium]